jgi:hypothetical protein
MATLDTLKEEERKRTGAIPEPWSYNPSHWRQRIVIALVALPAFFLALWMGLYQWRLVGWVWDPFFGDQTHRVLDSNVSHQMRKWMIIPDAILGAAAYLGDIVFALAGSTRRWQYRPWLVVLFGIDVIPLGIVSAVLVVLQGTVVGAWCTMCLITAAISILLIFFAYDEVWSCLVFLKRVYQRSKDKRLLWDTLWGRSSRIAHEVGLEMTGGR